MTYDTMYVSYRKEKELEEDGEIESKKQITNLVVIKADNDGIYVAAADGVVILKEIQMPGKNKMKIDAYLRGNSRNMLS